MIALIFALVIGMVIGVFIGVLAVGNTGQSRYPSRRDYAVDYMNNPVARTIKERDTTYMGPR